MKMKNCNWGNGYNYFSKFSPKTVTLFLKTIFSWRLLSTQYKNFRFRDNVTKWGWLTSTFYRFFSDTTKIIANQKLVAICELKISKKSNHKTESCVWVECLLALFFPTFNGDNSLFLSHVLYIKIWILARLAFLDFPPWDFPFSILLI